MERNPMQSINIASAPDLAGIRVIEKHSAIFRLERQLDRSVIGKRL